MIGFRSELRPVDVVLHRSAVTRGVLECGLGGVEVHDLVGVVICEDNVADPLLPWPVQLERL